MIYNGCSVEQKREFIKAYEKVIEPFTKGKGINWEVGISLEDVSRTVFIHAIDF